MIDGGVDAILIETSQDLLQAKAAVIGARRALADAGETLPVIVQVTVETTGTMLLGTEIGAALTALEPLGIDAIGLNCATGPAEMSEHLRHLSRHARIPVTCMPNAGLPMLTKDGAAYPLTADELAAAHDAVRHRVRPLAGRRLLRYDAGAPRRGRQGGRRPSAASPAGPAPSTASPPSTSGAVPPGRLGPVHR